MMKTIYPLLSHYSSRKWWRGEGGTYSIGDAYFKFRPIQYCAKVTQTNFDEIPGFSVLSKKFRFKRYFEEISRHFRVLIPVIFRTHTSLAHQQSKKT